MGIAALVLGIIAFVFAITFVLAPLGAILAVIGLILGIVDTVKKGKTGEKKAISITGLVLSAIMFVILIVESILLLGVGILTYNAVTDYDMNSIEESMESTAADIFNAIYYSYKGTIKGVEVKALLSTVTSNNTTHQIDVYYEGRLEEPYTIVQQISASRKYAVSFSEDSDGYINRVYIRSER